MIFTKEWFQRAGIRALKTVAQTAIAVIGTSALISEVNWLAVLSASLLAGFLSLLTSIAGLPELNNKPDTSLTWEQYKSDQGTITFPANEEATRNDSD